MSAGAAIVRPLRAGLAVTLLFATVNAAEGRRTSTRPCRSEIGTPRANDLLKQCREVSLEGRQPCLSTRTCASIRDEIRRGCALLGTDAPALCQGYVDTSEDDEDGD